MELQQLIDQVKRGDALAFDRLVDAHRDMALGYARTLVADHQSAEDAVQDALIIAHRQVHALREPSAFGAWLRGIVRNRCLTESGRQKGEQLEALEVAVPAAPDDEAELVRFAIDALPEPMRTVLELHYGEGLTQVETANRLGISKAAVNMRLHAARARIKRRLVPMSQHRSPACEVGHVEHAEGCLVTLRFAPTSVPAVLARLESGDDELCVVRSMPDGLVQAIATTRSGIWTVGRSVTSTGEPFLGALDDSLTDLEVSSAVANSGFVETGVKSVDLFAPISQGGSVGIFAEWGLGTLVLVPELVQRLNDESNRATLYVFLPPLRDAEQWREVAAELIPGTVRLALLTIPVSDPLVPAFQGRFDSLDTKLVLARALAEQGIWPAIDPLRSRSKLDHSRTGVAKRVRELIERYFVLQYSTGPDAARSLSPSDWQIVKRGRLATRFLSQPFHVAAPYTGAAGVDADPAVAACTFAEIVDGAYDDLPKEAFAMAGDRPRGA